MRKEYVLKIIYDPEKDELLHISEGVEGDIDFCIEVNGKDIPISNEMGEYMMKYIDGVELGIS